uniref:SUN domain-containing protein n=1 Tax=Anopheles atroparvus TaxID=41427 RepID=A0AAG5D964_ANOAO
MPHWPSVDVYMVVNLYLVAFCYVKWQLSMKLVGAIAGHVSKMRKLSVLLTVCWVALFSQILAISNLYHDGLQDIPGPPSVITLVDNQHRELSSIESKLEENLEATLKNLSHNNVLNVPGSAGVSLHGDEEQHTQQPQQETTDGDEQESNNGTIEAEGTVQVEPSAVEQQDQPLLVMVPVDDGKPTREQVQDTATEDTNSTPELKPREVNLTEENPMPVFSEWAQKQMAEAEKKLGEVVNASAMKKGTKPAGSKTGGPMKLRAKNYAAPECGAKIIASNPEAQSTGSVLTAPKDEYLLNPCTSKIWFVVELCEPVQAERIELANFELFSSSPKEFSVSVSNRFPTRDWANVGQFTAKDERDVQSFPLHPHLFGKFVRVEILSHYNQEHFCPVSLFRLYGTSEFEAFETDNTPLQPDDDEDEDEEEALATLAEREVALEGTLHDREHKEPSPVMNEGGIEGTPHFVDPSGMRGGQETSTGGSVDGTGKKTGGKHPNNILKSAGEVVMNMVKKAAEALGKTGNDSNDDSSNGTAEGGGSDLSFARGTVLQEGTTPSPSPSSSTQSSSSSCVTLAYTIRCVNCTDRFRARLESTVNCKHNLLTSLLGIARIGRSFDSAQHFLCANVLGFNLPRAVDTDAHELGESAVCLNMRYSVLNLLPDELVAGLCNVVAYNLKLIPTNGGEQQHPSENDESKPTWSREEGATPGEDHRGEVQIGEKRIIEGDIPTHQHSNDVNGQKSGQQDQEQHASIRVEHSIDVAHTADSEGGSSTQHTIPPKEDVNMYNVATETPPPSDGAAGGLDEPGQNLPPAPVAATGQQDHHLHDREKEDHQHHWETIDETEGIPIGGVTGGPSGTGSTMVASSSNGPSSMATASTGTQKVQPESVFLRLSNRIKALERNMSLSGQYLEELSRRYRKQVEELQHSYAKTLHEIEEQNRRMRDSETSLREVNDQLRRDLFEFQTMVADWRNVVLAVLGVVVLLLLILILFVRSVLAQGGRRGALAVDNQRPAPLPQSVIDRELAQVGSDARPIRGRMLRRKSIDGMPVAGGCSGATVSAGDGSVSCVSSSSGVIIATAETSTGGSSMSPARLRMKRPSEEALNISGTYVNLLIDDGGVNVVQRNQTQTLVPVAGDRKKSKHKHRKVSAPSMMITVGNVITSTPSTVVPATTVGDRYELPKRSTSMVEPREQRFRLVNGTDGQSSLSPDHIRNRIDELPFLEDNDEFIIPTASDLSYDEFMPGSTASSGAIAAMREELVDGGVINGSETTEDVSELPTDLAGRTSADANGVVETKKSSSRRLSSPAFFKTSLLRSSLGSKKRSSKKATNGDSHSQAAGSSGTSSNTSSTSNTSSHSHSSNSSNLSGSSGQHSTAATTTATSAANGTTGSGEGESSKDSWYRWWSENRKQERSPSSTTAAAVSSSQQDATTNSSASSTKQARRDRLKAKSESPPTVKESASEQQQIPVKLSVSFNGDLTGNGGSNSTNGLEDRKSGSRGSIRRLFRKVF